MNIGFIKYKGETYHIYIKMFSPDDKTEVLSLLTQHFDILVWENVIQLEIINTLHDHILTGKLIYRDDAQAVLNYFMERPVVYLDISLTKLQNKNISPGEIALPEKEFSHRFLVENINNISTNQNEQIMAMSLISDDLWCFTANLNYSTFTKASVGGAVTSDSKYTTLIEESPINILSELYKQVGLTLNTNKVETKTACRYVTNIGENLLSAEPFLLKRAFNIRDLQSPGMVSIYYNILLKEYSLVRLNRLINNDPSIEKKTGDVYADKVIKIEIYNQYMADLDAEDKNTLKIVNIKNNTELFELLQPCDFHQYDYITNTFSNEKNIDILPAIPVLKGKDYQKKYYTIRNMISKVNDLDKLNYNRVTSTWHNPIFFNNDILNLLLNSTVAVVETNGCLERSPGDPILLVVDRTDNNPLYKTNGEWSCFKVHHIFGPSSYKNKLLLGRFSINNESIPKTIQMGA